MIMQLNPVDQYSNPIMTYGLSMKATVTFAATDVYTFYSTFNVDSVNPAEAYTIEITFPRDTSGGASYGVVVEVDLPVCFNTILSSHFSWRFFSLFGLIFGRIGVSSRSQASSSATRCLLSRWIR